MELKLLTASMREATLVLEDGGRYDARSPYQLLLNGKLQGTVSRCVFTLRRLLPDTPYRVQLQADGQTVAECEFCTQAEFVTLNVRDFGAHGDGETNDTAFLQAAILCCPPKGRVLVPRGVYRVTHLFLKSHLTLELARGAVLLGIPQREQIPVLPGMTISWDEESEYNIAAWEGNPLASFCSLITGVDVEDVTLCGEGIVDGGASAENWWNAPKQKRGAWRPRSLYLCRCQNIRVTGLTFRNSPAWNLHPYFSQRLLFADLRVEGPASSPNTDGFDPESCDDVRLYGGWFSVGDDCVAIKSGKLYMGRKYHTPCQHIEIAHCRMGDGHGGVTIGSEMSGGVTDLRVRDCEFEHTDRGLRIKTRRGRGQNGVIDNVLFERIRMRDVKAPLTANAFYYCDPDGHDTDVQRREAAPVDETTPRVGTLRFRQLECTGCQAAAGYFLGLPEMPIACVELTDVSVAFTPDALPFAPIMADGVSPCAGRGIYAENVEELRLCRVRITGQTGDELETRQVARVIRNDEE